MARWKYARWQYTRRKFTRLILNDFVVNPGAVPKNIGLRFTGADEINVTAEGELALRLANMDNPIIGFADETVQANLAELTMARSLLFPSLNVGVSYDWHQGSLIASSGIIRQVTRSSLDFGAGTGVHLDLRRVRYLSDYGLPSTD